MMAWWAATSYTDDILGVLDSFANSTNNQEHSNWPLLNTIIYNNSPGYQAGKPSLQQCRCSGAVRSHKVPHGLPLCLDTTNPWFDKQRVLKKRASMTKIGSLCTLRTPESSPFGRACTKASASANKVRRHRGRPT